MERAVTAAPGLAVAEWGPPDAEPVLAVHGITASSRSWIELAAALPERRILAPDLRGRGRSLDLPGPWGLRRHADDLAGELRRRGVGPVAVVGHSMGAFVSVALAARHPDLVAALVLVDGGLPLPAPSAGVDGLALLGPAAERLRTRYDSPDTHRALWRAHPALRDIWSPAVDDYVAYDLVPDGDRWRAAASLAAAAEDIQDLHGPDWYLAALAAVRCPAVFLRAARGLLDEPTALYPATARADARRLLPGSRTVDVPDVNHYSIVLAPAGAAAVADAVRRILPSDVPNAIPSPDTPELDPAARHPELEGELMTTSVFDGIDARDVRTDRLTARVLERPASGSTTGTVVLVHGNVSSSLFWQPLMLALLADLRVVAIDLRGFGGSETLPVDASRGVRDFSDDVAAVLDALGIVTATVVGWSLGGGVVMQLTIDRPDLVAAAVWESPVSPFGFGGTAADGSLLTPDGAGTGGGGANPDFVARLEAGDTSTDAATSPRTVYRTAYVADPAAVGHEDTWVASMLTTVTGVDNYPGDARDSASWPGFGAGTRGVLNTLAPTNFDLSGIAEAQAKPPVLWIRGTADAIVSDTSFFDLNHLGAIGAVPGWPGADIAPAQPMVTQTRDVLERYAANGGEYREIAYEGVGHAPHLERPAEFAAEVAALAARVAGTRL